MGIREYLDFLIFVLLIFIINIVKLLYTPGPEM